MGLIANQMLIEWCARLGKKIQGKKQARKEKKESLPENGKEKSSADQRRG